MKSIVEKVRKYATVAHKGQFRTKGKIKLPYIIHPEAVEEIAIQLYTEEVIKRFNIKRERDYDYITKSIRIISLTHDIFEDQRHKGYTEKGFKLWLIENDTEKELKEFSYEGIYVALKKLNKNNYANYLSFILGAKEYTFSSYVKRADIIHNMSDLNDGSLKDKYRMAEYILTH